MNELTSYNIKIHDHGYCSQVRTPLPSIQTIEQGVEIIKRILIKEVLCRHDLEDVNQAYRQIDLLERQFDQIPTCNSHEVLKKIIEKVKRIVKQENISAKNLISLYHLQNFSDKELFIKECFEKLFNQFNKNPEQIKNIAIHLPYCLSKVQFNEDVKALIGLSRSEDINKILNRKIEKFHQYERLKEAIANKKAELKKLREQNPQNYPAFLDELLDKGYIRLYNHLLEMRGLTTGQKRDDKVKEMTFSLLSHVTLETREAIIQKVESSIPPECQNILFLLGSSGAGKSTTLCYLRGDKMVLNNFDYESKRDNEIIGHSARLSTTFLPNIEVVSDWVIVDFPGFDDTNGQIISLGMECALKALICKYNPKVLILEDITNTGGKHTATVNLGLRLERLLDNMKDCLLGITKYTKDPDYIKIREIEKQQIDEPSKQLKTEINLLYQLKTTMNLNVQSQIEAKEQQLAKIEQEKELQHKQPLPETDEKKKSKEKIKEKENNLLQTIGLTNSIQFSDLEDSELLSSCLTILSEQKAVRVRPRQILDEKDRALLDERFKSDLLKEIDSKKYAKDEFGDIKNFEKNVLESSLIKTILFQSNPEIGQFLHLPEIDPKIVREYDKEIVGDCIKKYIKIIIRELDITGINEVLDEMIQAAPTKEVKSCYEEVSKKMSKLQICILGLELALPEELSEVKKKKAWDDIQAKYRVATKATEEKFKLPAWAIACLCLPVGIPYGILRLIKWKHQSNNNQKLNEEIVKTIKEWCNDLDNLYHTMLVLKDLEKIIEKQGAIDEAFDSVQISLNSVDDLKNTIKEKINKVKSVYGIEEWDKRVFILKEQFDVFFKNDENKKLITTKCYFLIGLLLDPNIKLISYNELQHSLKTMNLPEAIESANLSEFDLNNSDELTILIKKKDTIGINLEPGKDLLMNALKLTDAGIIGCLNRKECYLMNKLRVKCADLKIDIQRPLIRALLGSVLLSYHIQQLDSFLNSINPPLFPGIIISTNYAELMMFNKL